MVLNCYFVDITPSRFTLLTIYCFTAQETITKPTYREDIEKDWRLILHDDTVHTIQQVCDIVAEVTSAFCTIIVQGILLFIIILRAQICPLCPGPRAYEVTLQVHMTGAGTVAVANKKIITEYTKKLQAAGLTVSMAPDEEFERGDDGESDENG